MWNESDHCMYLAYETWYEKLRKLLAEATNVCQQLLIRHKVRSMRTYGTRALVQAFLISRWKTTSLC